MEYRKPLDEKQLRRALLHLRSLKNYLEFMQRSFPPRDAWERRLWRRARRCVQNFANSARARNAGEMNRWAEQADAETIDYWKHRRRSR